MKDRIVRIAEKLLDVVEGALGSKKFYASLLGLAVVAYGAKDGWDPVTTISAAGVVTGYIMGQGYADQGKEAAKAALKIQELQQGQQNKEPKS